MWPRAISPPGRDSLCPLTRACSVSFSMLSDSAQWCHLGLRKLVTVRVSMPEKGTHAIKIRASPTPPQEKQLFKLWPAHPSMCSKLQAGLHQIIITRNINECKTNLQPIIISARPHENTCSAVKNYDNFLFKKALWSSHRGSVEMNLTNIHEDRGSIPGLAQWLTDPVLPWAVVEVADVPWIQRYCGCDIGQRPQLWFDP